MHWASVLATYLRRGEAGLADIEDRLESDARDHPSNKFSKKQAAYVPQAPLLPTLWRTSCGRCRFWEEGDPGEPGHCHIVGREDDPYGGEAIHYRGVCGFWLPPEGEPSFAWVKQRLRPDGKTSVRGEYDPEMTAKERERKERPTISTEPDARRAAIHGEEEMDDDG